MPDVDSPAIDFIIDGYTGRRGRPTNLEMEHGIMQAIRLRRKLESDTVYLPELQPLVGKTVEMIVWEQGGSAIVPGTGDWGALDAAIGQLQGYDFNAWQEQREFDAGRGHDRLP